MQEVRAAILGLVEIPEIFAILSENLWLYFIKFFAFFYLIRIFFLLFAIASIDLYIFLKLLYVSTIMF